MYGTNKILKSQWIKNQESRSFEGSDSASRRSYGCSWRLLETTVCLAVFTNHLSHLSKTPNKAARVRNVWSFRHSACIMLHCRQWAYTTLPGWLTTFRVKVAVFKIARYIISAISQTHKEVQICWVCPYAAHEFYVARCFACLFPQSHVPSINPE